MIIVVLCGIYSGFFTVTEAAAMSTVYAFFVSVLVYRDMRLKDGLKTLLAAADMSAMILYIITNTVLFSFLLTSEQIPQPVSEWIPHLGLGKVGFLVMVIIPLLATGNFLESSSILMITAPLLFPMAMHLNIDPINLRVLMTVNMEIGMITMRAGISKKLYRPLIRMRQSSLKIRPSI